MISSYNKIQGPNGHLAKREAFTGNTMSGATLVEGGDYLVFSYETVIALVAPDGAVTIPDKSYSRTTSRHQNLCHAWLSGQA